VREAGRTEAERTLSAVPICNRTPLSRSFIRRLLRHGRSKPNEAGLIVSTKVWMRERERRDGRAVQNSTSSLFLPHTHKTGQRHQARARPRPDGPGAGQSGRVSVCKERVCEER